MNDKVTVSYVAEMKCWT